MSEFCVALFAEMAVFSKKWEFLRLAHPLLFIGRGFEKNLH